MGKRLPICLIAVVGLIASALPAAAQERRLSFIRDAEIEHTIRTFAEPIIRAAGLNPYAVEIHLVQDGAINAFVAGGQDLWLNTGLLMSAQNASEVIGVIAHETGHIAGGHLARGTEAVARARRNALISSIIGMAAAAAAGEGGVGAAMALGGQSMAQRGLLAFTRGMESSADQAALRYLEQAGYSSEGLLSFLERLADQELVPNARQAEYTMTHPLTGDRIEAVRDLVARSRWTSAPVPAAYEEMFRRMQAKLLGFLQPQQAMRRYGPGDTSIAGRYARAIAGLQAGDIRTALAETEALIAAEPNNAYFHELHGQALLETGRAAEALPAYQRAVALMPYEPQFLTPLAHAKLESGIDVAGAIRDLNTAVRAPGGDTTLAWHLLATAYGRQGDHAQAALALAEEALARRDKDEAMAQADRAQGVLPYGSAGWLRAEDIRNTARDLDD